MILIIFSCSFDDTTRFELSLKQLVFVFKISLLSVVYCLFVHNCKQSMGNFADHFISPFVHFR